MIRTQINVPPQNRQKMLDCIRASNARFDYDYFVNPQENWFYLTFDYAEDYVKFNELYLRMTSPITEIKSPIWKRIYRKMVGNMKHFARSIS